MKQIDDFSELSGETLVKLQVKIDKIRKYFLFYEDFKNSFSIDLIYNTESPKKYFSDMAHIAIYTLYRSIFTGFYDGHSNKKKVMINITDFSSDTKIKKIHDAIINITKKDVCHNDKDSQTFKIVAYGDLINCGSAVAMQSYLSDEQLKIIVDFLINEVLPKIENTIIKENEILYTIN